MDMPPVITTETMIKYFLPPFLHIVLPFLILMVVFSIVRIVFARIFRSSRILRVLVDSVIILLFLVAAILMVPIVINTVKLPDAESGTAVDRDMTEAFDAYVSVFEDAVSDANPDLHLDFDKSSSVGE